MRKNSKPGLTVLPDQYTFKALTGKNLVRTMNLSSKSLVLACSTLVVILLISSFRPTNLPPRSSSPTLRWSEKLGFPAGKRVIILHADDVGMCAEANIAAIHDLKENNIQSAAIMMPCPYANEMIEWAKKNTAVDVGLHLTLTSEWRTYRWGPVSQEAPTLMDDSKKLWSDVKSVVMHATAEDVEKEVRAQLQKSISLGYRPDHIDTHEGTLYGHLEYMKAFFKIAEEYHIPANVIDVSDPVVLANFRSEGYPLDDAAVKLIAGYTLPKLDFFTSVPEGSSYAEKVNTFKQLVRSLEPGLTEIYFHPSVETENLKTITYLWQQRVWEGQMFSDPDLQQFFKDEGIVFTNWKEIMKRFDKQ